MKKHLMIQSVHKADPQNRTQIACLSPFISTGKERDEETGYNYHGARYYDASLLTGWLSVDPLADNYPSLSPYNYCALNPVKLVDPDGRKIDSATVTNEIWDLVNSKSDFAEVFNQLANDQTTIFKFEKWTEKKVKDNGDVLFGEVSMTQSSEEGPDIISIGYTYGIEGNGKWKSRALCEEVYHAKQFLDGDYGFAFNGTRWGTMALGYDDEQKAHLWSGKVCGLKDNTVWGMAESVYYGELKKYDNQSAEYWYTNVHYRDGDKPQYFNGVYRSKQFNMRQPK